MKKLKLSICAMIFAMSQLQAVDIAKNWDLFSNWSHDHLETYKENLMIDTQTQLLSLSAVGLLVLLSMKGQDVLLHQCVNSHQNSHIMKQANLIYVTYEEFLDIIASVNSYAATLEFIKSYCTELYFLTSHSRINRFIGLAGDLQIENMKRNDAFVLQENALLEEFKHNLLTAQENIQKERLNDAIDASKNANNLSSISTVLEIIVHMLQTLK